MLRLRKTAVAPLGLSYIIAPQIAGAGVHSLGPDQQVDVPISGQMGQQISLALVGLEPNGGDMESCCMSNQLVHVPKTCPLPGSNVPVGGADVQLTAPPLDFSVSIVSDAMCTRTDATAMCKAVVTVLANTAIAAPVHIAVTAAAAQALSGDGLTCTEMPAGQAICAVPAGSGVDLTVQLRPQTKGGATQLCAALGIPSGDAARTLALQMALASAGYKVGKADGKLGPATMAALSMFMADSGLPALTDEIPAEALAILGLLPNDDADPSNNQSCTVLRVPDPPLRCDSKTTRQKGGACACRSADMRRLSDTKCACPKGLVLGAKGCVAADVAPRTDTQTPQETQCNNPTVVKKGGACACRYKNSAMTDRGICLCKSGLPPIPGLGCSVQFSIDISPSKPPEPDPPQEPNGP